MVYDDEAIRSSWIRQHWKTTAALALILLLAGVFRVAFNYAPAINDGECRFAGNDDYYHLRVVDHVTGTGTHLVVDPLLNFPSVGINPRPPLFDWAAAIGGKFVGFLGECIGGGDDYALEWGSAGWGVLTCIPIWLIGRNLYSNRAGLWAAFLLASAPAHIQRSTFGLGDHDAMIIFFLVLGTYFLLRALRLTRDQAGPTRWTDLGDVARAMGVYASTHREGLAYAFLAGISWAAIGVMWEGYPYVPAIYAIYYGFQLLTNHIRRRDSTGDVLIMVIVMGLLTLVPLPYFWDTGRVAGTLTAATYILAGLVVATVALVPTRDLPAILTLPVMAVLALLFWAIVTFVFPDIGQQIFSVNGYFSANKIYSTIAEAQKTQLGVFVFSIGFMTFFLALIGFVYATIRFFKTRERDQLYLVAWGLISIYMAFAATRFVFNAAPVFAVLAGWMIDKVLGWMNFRERLRTFQALRHDSYGRAFRSVMGPKQITGSLGLVALLILPNLFFSVDAAIPQETRRDLRDGFASNFIDAQGAFGSGFLQEDWIKTYQYLDKLDQDREPAQRPAQIAWWDYGFWEVAIAKHPTVADNFQNGVQIAGRMLIAESEKELAEWMIVRLIEGDWRQNRFSYSPELLNALRQQNASLPERIPSRMTYLEYDETQKLLAQQTDSALEAYQFYLNVSDALGEHFGYLVVDFRMLPYDVPDTPRIDSGSIFYAPVFLANRNPDDYVKTVYVGSDGEEYSLVGYEMDADNNSVQKATPQVLDATGQQYIFGGSYVVRALEDGKRIDYSHNQGQGVDIVQEKLTFDVRFYRTIFYRAFIGGDGEAPQQGNYHPGPPGNGLRFWKMIHSTPTVKLLQFSLGADVSGQVTFEGRAARNLTVEAADEFGAAHDSVRIGADGRYTLRVPQSTYNATSGQLEPMQIRVVSNGAVIESKNITITAAQARGREPVTQQVDFALRPGALDLFAYIDRDRNNQYNASIDQIAKGARLTYEGVSGVAGDDGKVMLRDLQPGGGTVTGAFAGYQSTPVPATILSGQTTNGSFPFQPAVVTLSGTVRNPDGVPVPNLEVRVNAKDFATEYTQVEGNVPPTTPDGNFSVQVRSGGTYIVEVNATRPENNDSFVYRGRMEVEVPIGGGDVHVDLQVTRTRED